MRVVYDGLLAYHYASADPQVLVPDLATSVPEPTDGGRTYTFNLRPGIRYSTGAEVRASDFVRGVQRALLVGARPDFYAGIVGGQACIDDPASCDLSQGCRRRRRRGSGDVPSRGPGPTVPLQADAAGRPDAARDATGSAHLAAPGHRALPDRLLHPEQAVHARPQPLLPAVVRCRPAGRLPRRASAGSRWPTPTRRRTPCSTAERTSPSSRPWASRPALRSGRSWTSLRVVAPSRVHSSIVQGTDFGVLNSSVPPFDNVLARRAFNYAVDRNKVVKLLGGPSRGPPDLPADATEHAVVRALLPVHARARRATTTRGPTSPGRATSCSVRHPGHEGDGHRRGRRLLPSAGRRTSPTSCARSGTA